MQDDQLILIERQILARIARNLGLNTVKLINLAGAAEDEGALVQDANLVLRLVSWKLEHEDNSTVVKHTLNYLLTLVVQDLAAHTRSLVLLTRIYNALFKWSPRPLGLKLGKLRVMRPIEITAINFKGVTDAKQYVYEISLSLAMMQTSGTGIRDYCVDIGQCNFLDWHNLLSKCEQNEEYGTLPDGTIVKTSEFPEAKPGVPIPELIIAIQSQDSPVWQSHTLPPT